MLIHLLSHEDSNVQVAAAQGLAMMAESMMCKESIGQWGEFNIFNKTKEKKT